MDGDEVGGRQILRQADIRSGNFNGHSFNFDQPQVIDNFFSTCSQKYLSCLGCYLVKKLYLWWYLVIATASPTISLYKFRIYKMPPYLCYRNFTLHSDCLGIVTFPENIQICILITWTFLLFIKIMLWSTCKCFLKS